MNSMFRMMIVEDEPLIRKGIARMVERLSSDFYIVKESCSAEEALHFLDESRVDVIISDIRMGDLDGVEMSGILAEKYPDILVVLLSGYSDFAYAKKAIDNKVFAYLLKPLDESQMNDLLQNIKKELHNKRTINGKRQVMELHVTGKISYLFWMVKQKDLVFYMESGQDDKVASIVDELFEYMDKNALKIYVCKQLTLELLNMIINASIILEETEKQNMIEETCREENLADITDMSALKTWFVKKLREMFERFSKKDQYTTKHVIEEIKVYIEENYGSELSLTKIADIFGFNSFYLSNLFKVYTGSNFWEFVNQTRMRKAMELLKEEDLKIYEIAGCVGYQNVNNFTNLFKKYTGTTPGEFRKRLNKKISDGKDEE